MDTSRATGVGKICDHIARKGIIDMKRVLTIVLLAAMLIMGLSASALAASYVRISGNCHVCTLNADERLLKPSGHGSMSTTPSS